MQDAQTPPPSPPPGGVVMQMLIGRLIAQAIGAAALFRFADHLADGPKSAEELASLTGTHGPSVYRLLRALAASGIFVEEDSEGRRFANTPLSEALRADVPGSMRGFALFFTQEFHVRAWLALPHSIRTGESAFEHVYGEPLWSYLRANPELGAVFDDAMTSNTAYTADPVATTYDFSGINTLVDVGGGRGGLLASILAKNPGLRGVLFDQPQVVEGARALLEASGVADRCRIEGGDFFKEVPEGDAYILKHIVHDWSDDDSVAILTSVARAAKPGTRLILCDAVIKPGNEPDLAKVFDMEMLVVTTGGRERTAKEFEELVRRAGFRLSRIVETSGPVQIIEAIRT
ncbi:MAG TPA: methyltransferase [Polyangiaceae bacterium]|nr:methyltransferase [Polyangiaceae bacterium]